MAVLTPVLIYTLSLDWTMEQHILLWIYSLK